MQVFPRHSIERALNGSSLTDCSQVHYMHTAGYWLRDATSAIKTGCVVHGWLQVMAMAAKYKAFSQTQGLPINSGNT